MTVETLEERRVLTILLNELGGSDSNFAETRVRSSTSEPYAGSEITPDWIEIRNTSSSSVNLGGYHLTDDDGNSTKWEFPAGAVIAGNGYLLVFASGENVTDTSLDESGSFHTNFSLRNGGEYLAITDPAGSVVYEFSPEFSELVEDYSFGLDNSGNPAYFENATPSAANDVGSIVPGFVDDTEFSVDRGFFAAPFTVTVTSDTPGATISYTTDGSEPTLTNGTIVAAPNAATPPTASVFVATTTNLRARAWMADFVPTNVDTQSYIFLDDVIQQPLQAPGFPTSWGGAPAVDYGIDPQVANNPAYTDDLLAGLREIPTLSVTSEIDDLFGSSGIYSNTQSDLEIAASAELIYGDGSTGFQIDAGLKVQGGASRSPSSSPKHALSLRFRDTYGEGKLEFPLYEDGEVTSFDSLQLRARYNNSWIHRSSGQRDAGTLIRDEWVRDALVDMGQHDAGRGLYSHLYINGIYWGIYSMEERPDAAHYAEYFGGDEDDYDALNGGSPSNGNLASYNAMQATVQSRDWDAIQQVLDVDNFIDWTIIQRFGSNRDLKSDGNWRAAGGGPDNAPWRFYAWDTERIFENTSDGQPAPDSDPTDLLQHLDNIAEFRLRFADRLQMHMFNDGALTPDSNIERWNARADQLTNAIVAESARWGDYRRDVHCPSGSCNDVYTRDEHWTPEVNDIANNYFPVRTNIVLNQYEDLNLFPGLDAPIFEIGSLAQHGGQVAAGSQLSFDASANVYYTLDGTDPRAEGGAATGILWRPGIDPPVTLTESVTVKARSLSGSTWSALQNADFLVPATDSIVVSEINFNPHDPTADELDEISSLDNDDFEFLELLNTHPSDTVNLLGMQLTAGVDYEFPDVSLAPGERALVVRNSAAIEVRYGNSLNVLGEYDGGLSNSGEKLELTDGVGTVVWELDYDDGDLFSESADGNGASLVWNGDYSGNDEPGSVYTSWSGSREVGGSPGLASQARSGVVINEVLTNSTASVDSIELRNTTNLAIDIGGWFLSDSDNDLFKFEIPAGTLLPANGYISFDESQFNPTPASPGPGDFALSSAGDDVWLTVSDAAGGIAEFVDDVHFGAAPEDHTLARVPDGAGRLQLSSRNTVGCSNHGWLPDGIVISEVNYAPQSPGSNALSFDPTLMAEDLEYIELTNQSGAAVDLSNWLISGGVDLAFAPGSSIAAGESIIAVNFDPAGTLNRALAFRAEYGISPAVRMFEYSGRLDNSGEALRLERPDPLNSGVHYQVDEMIYDELQPWNSVANGGGLTLQRTSGLHFGNNPVAWQGNVPTPGFPIFASLTGDLNGDGEVAGSDIDLFYDAIERGSYLPALDLNNDGALSNTDLTLFVENTVGILMGDANFDGVTDASDFNIWNSNKFTSCGTWSTGDFNGDTFVDGSDFNVWNSNKFRSADAATIENTTSPVMSIQLDGINESPEQSDDGERRERSTIQLIDRVFANAGDSAPGER